MRPVGPRLPLSGLWDILGKVGFPPWVRTGTLESACRHGIEITPIRNISETGAKVRGFSANITQTLLNGLGLSRGLVCRGVVRFFHMFIMAKMTFRDCG